MNTQKRLSITDFLSAVPSEHSDFMSQAHECMNTGGYKTKFEIKKKRGFTVQYLSPKTRGLVLQFFISENVLYMYLYNLFLHEFNGFLESLPSVVINGFAEYRDCTNACNPVCTDKTPRLKFSINGTYFIKCPSGQLLFTVDDETKGVLSVMQNAVSEA